jgi:hypothetical protein
MVEMIGSIITTSGCDGEYDVRRIDDELRPLLSLCSPKMVDDFRLVDPFREFGYLMLWMKRSFYSSNNLNEFLTGTFIRGILFPRYYGLIKHIAAHGLHISFVVL